MFDWLDSLIELEPPSGEGQRGVLRIHQQGVFLNIARELRLWRPSVGGLLNPTSVEAYVYEVGQPKQKVPLVPLLKGQAIIGYRSEIQYTLLPDQAFNYEIFMVLPIGSQGKESIGACRPVRFRAAWIVRFGKSTLAMYEIVESSPIPRIVGRDEKGLFWLFETRELMREPELELAWFDIDER